ATTGTQAASASTAIIKLMARAQDRLPNITSVKDVFYVNRTVASHLRLAALEKSSAAVTIEPAINQFGQNIHQLTFLGTPVKIMDTIINTEAAIS
ncbi:phage major capsid protein, partial [Bacillus sp. L75]|uniref:phage major capsid protein n=1 Tax=Bacillus sp. L75 TaxID=1267944 RepID=UPI000F19F549